MTFRTPSIKMSNPERPLSGTRDTKKNRAIQHDHSNYRIKFCTGAFFRYQSRSQCPAARAHGMRLTSGGSRRQHQPTAAGHRQGWPCQLAGAMAGWQQRHVPLRKPRLGLSSAGQRRRCSGLQRPATTSAMATRRQRDGNEPSGTVWVSALPSPACAIARGSSSAAPDTRAWCQQRAGCRPSGGSRLLACASFSFSGSSGASSRTAPPGRWQLEE